MQSMPDALVEEIRRGRVVLLLGAGASLGATNDRGQGPPGAPQLRDSLADRFLGGGYRDSPLAWVADLAISEADLITVQEFIAETLRGMRPAPFHQALAKYKWRGIATTNYDLIMEAAYGSAKAVQNLIPFLSDRDRVDEKLRAQDSLAYLKLHGCITRTHDPELPLILTADQYVTHRRGRKYIFTTFEQWAHEYPVIFVGSSGQDPDLRAVLLEVSHDINVRPRFYLLKPLPTETERRFWESKRVSLLDGTLEDMTVELEKLIPESILPLFNFVQADLPIKRRFAVNEEVSSLLEAFLVNDVEYVHAAMPIGSGTPAAFYRGFDLGWFPVVSGLDVRRRLADAILSDVVIRAEQARPVRAELYVVKAEAGAGKTVLLRRLAWEAATQADLLCIYLQDHGMLHYESIRELYRVTQQRIFLFVDGAADHIPQIAAVMAAARREDLPITVFTAERMNVWNMSCERLAPLLTDSFDLRYLSHSEVEALVDLLAKHNSLGPNLTGKNKADCVKQFEERAGRQLLVALHEATLGRPFEEILVDEYNQVQPHDAQQLYLTVCVLNRLNVAVRAGLIARIQGISFEDFKLRLFLPLEHVVKAEQHPTTKDFLYISRHPEIAQIVFERILRSPQDRFREYVRIISNLNLAFSTDWIALRGLLKAKALDDLFPDDKDVRQIFGVARQVGPNEAYILQQQANYERIRTGGNLVEAERLLQQARELEPKNTSLVHTLAEVMSARADNAPQKLERDRFRGEARQLLAPLLGDNPNDRYARHTMIKLGIADLRELLEGVDPSDAAIDAAVRRVEDLLQRGLQRFPDDQFLLTAEADYSHLLEDHERSFAALRKAFDSNKRDPYIASRLARLCKRRGDLEGARQILHDALQANRGDQQLNFQYAAALRKRGEADDQVTILYHLRRSFAKWDSNYEAQFWFARYAFESSDQAVKSESKEAFRRLRSAPISFETRRQVRDSIWQGEEPRIFFGTIARLDYAYGFIVRDGNADLVFFHKNDSDIQDWGLLRVGLRVTFTIGFTFNGPIAQRIASI